VYTWEKKFLRGVERRVGVLRWERTGPITSFKSLRKFRGRGGGAKKGTNGKVKLNDCLVV